MRIEDYAIIGDTHTAAVVGNNGSIDWLCVPRFDGDACFAALLGDGSNGHWLVAPKGEATRIERRYRGDSLVLETTFETKEGAVRLVDAMPIREHHPHVVRVVEGVRGRVPMRAELTIRFDYGRVVPWVRKLDGRLVAIAGPSALALTSTVPTHGEGMTTVGDFSVASGERASFVLSWYASHEKPPECPDAERCIEATEAWWRAWIEKAKLETPYRDEVVRSLVTLKALTYAPTGGILAAATTSLPETLGGVRNWDYRYCWLRDSTFTLYAMLQAGLVEEAKAWRDWLLRAIAGDPSDLQIMYGAAGERRIDERELAWLSGYECSKPVRIGNAAAGQLQLDVYGEVIDTFHQARRAGIPPDHWGWNLQKELLDWLESGWKKPDEGLWEVRGPRRHFTHSKVMAWVAMDRAAKAVEKHGLDGPADRWRAIAKEIHADVCKRAFDQELGAFTQSYGSKSLDAATLLIPSVGFLPPDDPRVVGTVRAIEKHLMRGGFVQRYATKSGSNADGLPGVEGAFLACSFWLVDAYALMGRKDDARRLFERLLSIRNDVGLLSEEYDPDAKRLVGNFPQAFSHVGLINGARDLSEKTGAAADRNAT